MLASKRTAWAMVRKRWAPAAWRAASAFDASTDFKRAMVTHCRTLMPSGQIAEHCPLPSHAAAQRAASPPPVASRVIACSPRTSAGASAVSSPISRAVGQTSAHLPQVVQRSAADAAMRSSWSA
jgi:hypothetical protein